MDFLPCSYGYRPGKSAHEALKDLSKEEAADACGNAILMPDLKNFGRSFRASFEAQVAMFPHMVDGQLRDVIDSYRSRALGWKLSGAGGGGYLILVTEHPINGTIKVKIRRS